MRLIVYAGVFGFSSVYCVRILQLSDIHISHYHKKSSENLKAFRENDFASISALADVVVLSGDLTDASPPFYTLTQRGQQPEDWTLLSQSFAACLKGDIPIFSVRGNHDGFGVAEYSSESNAHYRTFAASLAKRRSEISSEVKLLAEHEGTQILHFPKTSEILILLDSVYNTGVSRHFYGHFPVAEEDWLEAEMAKIGNSLVMKAVTVISHYPIGTYRRQDRERLLNFFARHKIRSFHAGHLHTILGRPMTTTWKFRDGNSEHSMVEHEIADFKAKEIFRIIETVPASGTVAVFDFRRGVKESVSEIVEDGRSTKQVMKVDITEKATKSIKTSGNAAKQGQLDVEGGETSMTTKFTELGVFARTLFKNFQESIDSMALIAHAFTVLLSLFVYLKTRTKTFYVRANLVLVGLLPVLPFALTQVFAGSVGLNFWWGGLSIEGISSNDTVASDVILLDFKIFFAMCISVLYGRFHNLGVRVVGGLLVLLTAVPSIYLNMYRGGLVSLISLTLAWDVFFWVYGPLGLHLKSGNHGKAEGRSSTNAELSDSRE